MFNKRKIVYFFTFILTCLSILFFSSQWSNNNLIAMDDIDHRIDWSQEIIKIDEDCKEDYQNFFRTNFTDEPVQIEQVATQLKTLKQETGKNAAAIWVWSYPEALELAMITAENKPVGKRFSDVNALEIDTVIDQYTNYITKPFLSQQSSTSSASAQKLYQWIIKPLETQLQQENIDTLIICVGPRLRSIPFAAFSDGTNFLVEKYSISMVPSFALTNLDISRKNQDEIQILAMGMSNFEFLSPLPGVTLEINNIVPAPWDGVKMTENLFTLENLRTQREQNPYEIIHLATHAKFQPGDPADSFIQLSDRPLTLTDIRDLNWHSPPVSLLTLSACETAMGDAEAELGFGGLAVQSGVRSALGSYWQVSDAGTLALMSEFYQHLKSYETKTDLLLKSDALRDTQVSMINRQVYIADGQLRSTRGNLSLPSISTQFGDEDLSHPFYWAPFTIIGSPW
ncbi:hypothetical protein AA637_09155 [Cyanobacterium sp. HL-69]|uniref:CHAT domain-containing protein n=1 Tax=Cyanobacterium sp. HL-69 TaxID=2054282 RepID=UPI000CA2341C|nr:hypothetical protein AA637_09155 [Cyanobacterium sp. HL-69]